MGTKTLMTQDTVKDQRGPTQVMHLSLLPKAKNCAITGAVRAPNSLQPAPIGWTEMRPANDRSPGPNTLPVLLSLVESPRLQQSPGTGEPLQIHE